MPEEPADNPARIAEEHLAIRLNDMDLQRAVEQVAILMSLFSEVQATNVQRETAGKHAFASLMGYLSHAWCRGSVKHQDYRHTGNDITEEVWSVLERAGNQEGTFGIIPAPEPAEDGAADPAGTDWDLDFVLSPLDGVRAFFDGLDSGSLSVIAGGRPGTFPPDKATYLADDYLVVATGEAAVREEQQGLRAKALKAGLLHPSTPFVQGKEAWQVDLQRASRRAESDFQAQLRSWEALEKRGNRKGRKKGPERRSHLWTFLQELVEVLDGLPSNHLVRSWATSANEARDFAFRFIRPTLRTRFKLRTFNGSSVAAGLSAYFPHLTIDGYVGVIRRTHAILLAVAAQATGGNLLAVPVQRKEDKEQDYELLPDKPVLERDDLVKKGNDVFLVATGVSENLLVEGVRFRPNALVSTHTLCLRSGTRSTRFISHHHDLHQKEFRLLPEEFTFLDELLGAIEKSKKVVLKKNYLRRVDGGKGEASLIPQRGARRRAKTNALIKDPKASGSS